MKLSHAIIVALTCTGFIFAQATTTPATPAPEATPAPAPVKKAAAPKQMKAQGTIVSTSAELNNVVVKEAKGDVTFTVNEKTVYKKGGKVATLADLTVGGKVKVTYTVEGEVKTATQVSEQVAPAPKAKKEPAKTEPAATEPAKTEQPKQ